MVSVPSSLCFQEFATQVEGEDWFQVFDAGESTEVVGLEVFRQTFDADLSFGLQAAEFGSGAVQVAMGLCAGAVDGLLCWGACWIDHGIELKFACRVEHVGFDYGTPAKTPGGVDDLGGERLLERSFGFEFVPEIFAEVMVEAVVFREHEVGGGVDAESDGVAGGTGFAFFGARPGGGFWALRRLAAI